MSEIPAAAVRELHMALVDEGWISPNTANVRESLTRALAAAAPLIRQATADEIAAEMEQAARKETAGRYGGMKRAAGIARRVGGGGGGGGQ
jgi:hypothetical protein